MKNFTDEELINRFIHTNQNQYFNALYRRYYPKVLYRCLYYTSGDLNEAEDWAQNVFIRVLEKVKDFRKEARFSTWLTTITINYCIDLVRVRQRQIISLQDINLYADFVTNEDTEPHESTLQQLRRAVGRLDETERALLAQKYQEGHSIKLLADQYEVSESALKMRLKRAKKRLKDNFQQIA